jgi:uncharacterized protein YkwD
MKSLRPVAVTLVASIALLGLLPVGAQAHRTDARRAHGQGAHAARGTSASRAHHEPNYAWQLFRATNTSRLRHGLRPLRRNHDASRVAERHSAAMARANELFHSSAMGPYLNGVGRWRSWGENIGWTSSDVADLQRAFMHSSVHRVHILSHTFRHVAVGAVMAGHKLWVTLVFYG